MKNFYKKHKNEIKKIVIVITAIILFISGYLICWNLLEKPMSNEDFKRCEIIAQDVYEQRENVIVEVPEEFWVKMDATTITVELSDYFVRGKVNASLHNGELVFTHNLETADAVIFSMMVGYLFFAVGALIYCGIGAIKEKRNK